MTSGRIPGDERDLARDAFHRAEGSAAADVERLLRAVPAILADAARRRARDHEPSARIVATAWAWMPRFAIATALLTLAALVWPSASRRAAGGDESGVLDAWVMTGTLPSSVADPALDAILRQDAR